MLVTAWTTEKYAYEGFAARYTWIDFVNSQHWDGFGNEVEYLTDPTWRAVFLRTLEVSAPVDQPFPIEFFENVRKSLRVAATQIAEAGNVSSGVLKRLNGTLGVQTCRRIQYASGSYQLMTIPINVSWNAVAADIVASFGECLQSGQLRRIKTCSNENCRWLFIDATKNNARRWCNDRLCSNRDRVNRFRLQ